jgi:hypothetical protein
LKPNAARRQRALAHELHAVARREAGHLLALARHRTEALVDGPKPPAGALQLLDSLVDLSERVLDRPHERATQIAATCVVGDTDDKGDPVERHFDLAQTRGKVERDEVRPGVIAIAILAPDGRREHPTALVVANRVRCEARLLAGQRDLHLRLLDLGVTS